MEKSGLRGILILLSIAGILAPASEMIGRSASPRQDASPTAATGSGLPPTTGNAEKPRLSPEELRRALDILEKRAGDTGAQTLTERREHVSVPARDPFSLLPLPPPITEPSPPAVRLLGIVGSGNRDVATLVIEGQVVTMEVGQEVNGVRLRRVSPPDGADVEVQGRRVVVRVGR